MTFSTPGFPRAVLFTLGLIAGTGCTMRRQTPDSPGPGVSHSLAQHRAATISNVRYDLTLDVTSLDSAVGRVVVRFVRSDTGDVFLDFRGRRLALVSVKGERLPGNAFDGAHVRLPRRLLQQGENAVELGFIADIAPSGASIIRFHDASDASFG